MEAEDGGNGTDRDIKVGKFNAYKTKVNKMQTFIVNCEEETGEDILCLSF